MSVLVFKLVLPTFYVLGSLFFMAMPVQRVEELHFREAQPLPEFVEPAEDEEGGPENE